MAIIKLTRGFETIVDDSLFQSLNQHNWYASGLEGRPARRLKEEPRRLIYLYHQALSVRPWDLSANGLVVHHVNHNPLDNRLENLVIVTQKANMRYSPEYGNRRGISFDNTHKKYKVYIDLPDHPRVNVGTFTTEVAANAALTEARGALGLEDN